MNFLKRGLIYGGLTAGTSLAWYKLGLYDINDVRERSFNAGVRTSQRFKKYPAWDKYAEPFIIKQSSVAFTAGHAYLEGMASDNADKKEIQEDLQELENKIKDELEK